MSHPDLESPEVDQSTLEAWGTHLGRPITDPAALREQLGAGSLPEAFAVTARRRPGVEAIRVGDRGVSHAQLDVMAGRAAAALARLGVVVGSRVMVIADVGIEEIAAYLGILRLGATVVLVNPALTRPEMQAMALGAGAEVVVGSGPGLVTAVSAVSQVDAVTGLRPSDRDTVPTLLGDITETGLGVVEVPPDAVAVLAFTSGTTGHPKPTPLSHRNLLASVRGAMAAWRWTEQDHLIHSLPISHQHGLSGVHATLLAGSRLTLLGSFDPERTVQAVMSDASIHFGVPTIHQRLLDALGTARARELGRLRLAVSGSGPLPRELALRYREATGRSLLERYGTTESGLDVSNPYFGDRIPGRVGLVLPGVELALVDESGSPAAEGETGEILVRGPQVFAGHVGDLGSEQPFMRGWFRTGDLGSRDLDTGYLAIMGRTKEVIISGGMNIYPREVEDVLRRHPAVTDAVVLGIPSHRWGEEVVAIVSPPTVNREELLRYSAEHLASYKRPKRVVLVEEVPRDGVGKPKRDEVLRLIPPAGAEMPLDGIGSPARYEMP
jgi:malonyl-CoA/methylmalonyl-CoA synthetase